MTPAESKIHDTLHHGTADQVLALSCPRNGGPIRIEYCETKGGSHMRITGTQSDFIVRMSGRLQRPSWVDVLGTDFVTRPRVAEPGASPNGGPAEPLGNSGVGGGPPSVS